MNSNLFIESLLALGGKKSKKGIDFLANSLLIRDKKSRVEYTVQRISNDDNGKPVVICYRYYMPKDQSEKGKKVFIKIPSEDFTKYEPV